MPHWKKIATFYLFAGAGVTAWAYMKGYALSPALIVTWPMNIGKVSKAASLPSGSPRAALPS